MKKLSEFDDWLLFKHQAFADWVYKLIGITNFRLSAFAYLLSVSLLILRAALISPEVPEKPLMLLIITGICTVFTIERFRYCKKCEKEHKQGTINRKAYVEKPLRFVMATLIIFLALPYELAYASIDSFRNSIFFMVGFWSVFMTHLYFMACTPLPPGQSKLKQAWNNFLLGLNHRLQPQGIST